MHSYPRDLLLEVKEAIVETFSVDPAEGEALLTLLSAVPAEIRYRLKRNEDRHDTQGKDDLKNHPDKQPDKAALDLSRQTKGERSLTADYLIMRAMSDRNGRAQGLADVLSHVTKLYPDLDNAKGRSYITTKIARLRNEKLCIAKQADHMDRSYSITDEGRNYQKKLETAYLKSEVLAHIRSVLGS